MQRRLDAAAIEEIQTAMYGLRGKTATRKAQELASRYGVSTDTIYTNSKSVRPKRQPRADRGSRRAHLLEHDGLKLTAALVTKHKMSPALAMEVAQMNGKDVPYSVGSVRRILRENGLSRDQARIECRPHRRFEATRPGQMFQIDATGLKTRWLDTKTRKLLKITELEVSKNHPNTSSRRCPVWALTCVDDYSRRIYTQFFACDRLTQIEAIEFVLAAFREMGVPEILYTDNDKVLIGKRMQRVEQLLNKMFEDSGGFRLDQHMPGNPQATGKVENAHKFIEEFEKVIAVMPTPNLVDLNRLGKVFCTRKNNQVHRTTGVAPILRWREGWGAIRVPPSGILDEVMTARDLENVLVRSDVCLEIEGQVWQLPFERPYVDWAASGKKVRVIWPPKHEYFWILEADEEHEIEKILASAHQVGQFKAVPETQSQIIRKELNQVDTKQLATVDQWEANEQALQATRPAVMPKPKVEPKPELLAALGLPTGQAQSDPAQILGFVPPPPPPPRYEIVTWLTFFQAVEFGQAQKYFEIPMASAQREWLKQLFGKRTQIEQSELESALEGRSNVRLTAVQK